MGGGTACGAALGISIGAGFSTSGFLIIVGTAAGFSLFAALTEGAGLTAGGGAFFAAVATGFDRIFLGTMVGFGPAAAFGAGFEATDGAAGPLEPLDMVDCKGGYAAAYAAVGGGATTGRCGMTAVVGCTFVASVRRDC